MTASPALQLVGASPPLPIGALVVIKFGGTSLATASRLRRAARRVARLCRAGCRPVVVVSAAGHSTDRLLRRTGAAFGEPAAARLDTSRERDRALATGEDLSAALLAGALLAAGIPALSLRGAEAGILAAGEFGAGRPVTLHSTRLLALLARGVVPVVSGFQGVRADGETVTLGRGGSDVSAVFLAAALGAVECQIVTDVDGVHSADPNRDPDARQIRRLAHAELVRLTSGGALVVHPAAAALAERSSLLLRVFHHAAPFGTPGGTVVSTEPGVGRC